jgi:hypothetical protein
VSQALKAGDEVSFTDGLVRPNTNSLLERKLVVLGCPSWHSMRETWMHWRRVKDKVGMFLQEMTDDGFVFVRGKGAGTIDQRTAGSDHMCGSVKDSLLAKRTAMNMSRRPMGAGGFVFTKHAFTGAGSIEKNAVKKRAEVGCQSLRSLVCNGCIADAATLEVFSEVPNALGVDFVGDQQALVLHESSQVGGFSAWCSGEVQDVLARKWG